MPYSITTKDGITINNIPDDVPPDSQALKDRVAAIRSGASPVQMAPSHEVTPQMMPSHTPGAALPEVPAGQTPETTFGGVTGGIIRGAGPYGAGALVGGAIGAPAGGVGAVPGALIGTASVGASKLIGDPITNWVNRTFGTNWATPTETMEFLMDKLGIERPDTPAERMVQTAADVAGGSAGGMALGKLMAGSARPLVAGVGKTLMSQPGQQIAGALGSGAASQAAAELGGGPGTQFGAGLLGGMVGGALASPRRSTITEAYKLPELAAAEKAGIPVFTTDIAPPGTAIGKMARGLGEKVPIAGMAGGRRAQQAARVKAIENVLSEYGAANVTEMTDVTSATGKVMSDLLAKRSKDVEKYVGMKSEVFSNLSDSGPMPVPRATQAINEQIQRLERMGTAESKEVIQKLSDWGKSIQGKPIDVIEDIRKQIGEGFKGSDSGAIRSTGEKALDSIYGPLRDDMGSFIQANGARRDFVKWTIANKRLSESAGELTTTALKNILKNGEARPENIERLLFSSAPSDVKLVMKGLTAEGKSNARMAVLSKVALESGGAGSITPEKFLSNVRKRGASIGIAFEGRDADAIKGLGMALKLTRHAGEAGVAPLTGIQNMPLLAGGGLLAWLGGVKGAAAIATIGGAARVYESKFVRDNLIRLSKLKGGGPEAQAIVNEIDRYIAHRAINAAMAKSATKQPEENQ